MAGTEGIQLPDMEGLWEEAALYPEMVKILTSWLHIERSSHVVVYRRIPHGPVPVLLQGDRVEFEVEPQPDRIVFGGTLGGFVLHQRQDGTYLVAHGRGSTSAITTDAVLRVDRNGQEIWRKIKQDRTPGLESRDF